MERAATPRDYASSSRRPSGPWSLCTPSLADEPERAAALDREFLEFATRANRGAPGGPAEYRYEYVLVLARKRTG